MWTEKCVEAIQRLKELLMTTPILKSPNMDEEFLVCNDASKEGFIPMEGMKVDIVSYVERCLECQ